MSWIGELLVNLNNWRGGVSKVKSGLQKTENPLRIGVISAAAISFCVIIDTIQTHPDAVLVGIAARDRSKAAAQVAKYNLGPTCKAYESYDSLLADPDIDAVYIPTPNALHTVWTLKALDAGKHVLVEKPIASNADEARQIRERAQRTGKVVLEAFHWRFHPAAHHVKSLVEGGQYGAVTDIYVRMNMSKGSFSSDDIRFNYALGGGACMDLTYVFSTSSYFASADPASSSVRVLEATPRLYQNDKLVDEAMTAKFVIEPAGGGPVTCTVEADLAVPHLFGFIPQIWRSGGFVVVQLEKAEIEFANFPAPYLMHAITIREKDDKGKLTGKKHVEKQYVDGPQWENRGQSWWTTYRYQLEGFVDMIRAKEKGEEYHGPWMSLEESEKLMELIDQVYDKAGLPRRGQEMERT